MLRSFALFVFLSVLFIAAISAPCSGRAYFQSGSFGEIGWADVSTSDSGFTRPSPASRRLPSSNRCEGSISASENVVCCPTSNDIRCWNTSGTSVGSPSDLGVGLPSSLSSPLHLRISLEAKTIVLGSSSGSRAFIFDNFWGDGTGTWHNVDSTSDHGWNIIKLPSGPFFHVLTGNDSRIVRIPSSTLTPYSDITTSHTVQSLAHIGTESFGLLGDSGTSASIIRWVEDGTNTQLTAQTITGAIYSADDVRLTDAYSVGGCPYFLIYSSNGTVSFAESTTAATHTVDGTLSSSIVALAFARTISNGAGPPENVPVTAPSPSPSSLINSPGNASSPTTCPNPPSPISSFRCISGIWTSTEAVSESSLTISSGVIVSANLTADNLIFNGLQSNIAITGCVNVKGSVTLHLTAAEIQSLNRTSAILLSIDGCPNNANLSKIELIVDGPVNKCDTLGYGLSQEQVGTQIRLVALLNLDLGKCKNDNTNTIIIAICVPVGVILLVTIGIVIAAVCSSRFRTKFRPFAKKTTY